MMYMKSRETLRLFPMTPLASLFISSVYLADSFGPNERTEEPFTLTGNAPFPHWVVFPCAAPMFLRPNFLHGSPGNTMLRQPEKDGVFRNSPLLSYIGGGAKVLNIFSFKPSFIPVGFTRTPVLSWLKLCGGAGPLAFYKSAFFIPFLKAWLRVSHG